MEKRYSCTRITKQTAEDGRKRRLLKRKKEDSEDEKERSDRGTGSRRSCNRYDPSSEKSGLSSAGSGSRAPGGDPAAGGFERSGICRQCQGRGRGSRAHGRGSRREKEPERTSGTGNGTDLEERWCSGARGSGGTKHCSTSPGRRGRCDSGEEKSRDDKRDGAACDCPRTGLYGRRRCGCCN